MADPGSVIAFPPPSRPCAHDGAGTDCEHCKVRLVSICAALAHDELAALESIAQPVCFAARETLFLEGDAANAAYTVTSGTLRLYRIFHNCRRQIVGFLLPGDFIAIGVDGKYRYCADAISAVTLCRFGKREFTALVDDKPNLLYRLYDTAEQELESAREHIMALGQRSARERVAWFLIHLRDRCARVDPASDTVPIPMSRQDIADYLGLTIETISRTLSKLARDKAIEILPNGVKVTDVARIERLAAA
jgi:CRP/FNR family transcriptional regulator, anaerobic regulatory protein